MTFAWILNVVFIFSAFFYGSIASSEPWLGNRYAKNCAACHAPGRFNRPQMERRCTLSCQGCHVSPNGGGMRNLYGLWNQKRWLKSFENKGFGDEKRPDPVNLQNYMQSHGNGAAPSARAKATVPRKNAKKIAARNKRRAKSTKSRREQKGSGELRKVNDPVLAESDMLKYDEDHKGYGKIYNGYDQDVASEAKYLSRIPPEDPYRADKKLVVQPSFDYRSLGLYNLEENAAGKKEFRFFPMEFDVGIRLRARRKLAVVVESRFLNGPDGSMLEEQFTNENQVKSAYVLYDRLPYNSFVMAGLYRPLFGYINPDHESIAQKISGFTQRSVYKAFSFGLTYNVPFIQMHVIEKVPGNVFAQEKGFLVTAGANFVTLGASIMGSYWTTTVDSGLGELRKVMSSINGGLRYGFLQINTEFLWVDKEFQPDKGDAGNVITVQLREKFWREFYFFQQIGTGDLSTNLKMGSSSELVAGLDAFLISGLEMKLHYSQRTDSVTGVAKTDEKFIELQAHIYY